ncbi:trypsin-like peptidase domain-containing protein [Rhodopirellula bahusiensis]|uniref:trypsin-like peptidase domain-containing protein n=3 Tax=Rhodopirellula bahusiensis TaxID=2014065 RepID=UPI0032657407
MSFRHLDDAVLADVRDAAIEIRLYTEGNMEALGSDINPAFWGAIRGGGHQIAKLSVALNELNGVKNLVGGEVPMKRFLTMAIVLAAGRPQENVFRKALAICSEDTVPPNVAIDLSDVPRNTSGELEIQIDRDETLEVGFLHRGAEASRSVARLSVHRHFDGQPSFVSGDKADLGNGTGWIIAPDLIATNHHVVAARMPNESPASEQDFVAQGKSTSIQFDFYDDQHETIAVDSVECLVSAGQLDYALLKTPPGAITRPPLRLRNQTLTKSPAAALGARVNLLQHPDGKPMRLGFRNNFVITGSPDRLSYLTDTAGGSSGSPVFDDDWLVAALHRGWRPTANPVMIWGKEIHQENYGTPIQLILDDVKARAPDVHSLIENAQTQP